MRNRVRQDNSIDQVEMCPVEKGFTPSRLRENNFSDPYASRSFDEIPYTEESVVRVEMMQMPYGHKVLLMECNICRGSYRSSR
jgi:hypothetical protein